MKFLFLLIPSLIFLQTNWPTFTDMDGRFQISAPGKFDKKTDTLTTDLGLLVYNTFFYQTKDGENELYLVSYCDYPPETIIPDSTELIEDFFQTTIESAASSVAGEVLYQSDIQLDNHPGKFWRIDYNDGNAIVKTKAYLVKDRFYSIQVFSLKNKNINAQSELFLDSFKLL
ncbi:MAG: hypothetical protein AAFZ15_30790 [Bacteroidota bacterium]